MTRLVVLPPLDGLAWTTEALQQMEYLSLPTCTTIYYTNGLGVNDSFNYWITNSAGLAGTGVVSILVNNGVFGQGPTNVTISGGVATVGFAGIPGYAYEVQRATNLVSPNWVAIEVTNAPELGLFEIVDNFQDLEGTPPQQAFYRLRFVQVGVPAPIAPLINTQPASMVVGIGQNPSFLVIASGTPPLSYQWYFTNEALANKTSPSLTLNNVQTNQAGDYFVVVTNSLGSVTSVVATLMVVGPPSITTQPTNLTVTVGQSAAFSVVADGYAPLYQWYFNTNTPLANQTSATLTIGAAQITDAGAYSVVVANVGGSVTSVVATLTVLYPPSITMQPTSQAVTVGSNVTLSVVANGNPLPGYQWYFNTSTLLADATNASLTITNVQSSNAGDYTVVVTNSVGSVTSSVATLWTQPGAGLPSLPNINVTNIFYVTNYGAVGDGVYTNTTAIQSAINAAAGASGGGTVEITPGTYLSGPLTMKSKINLQIDSGATLEMLPKSSWPGTTSFILGNSLSDVEISGLGMIYGQGSTWWGSDPRPNLIEFGSTVRILIQNVTLTNPPTFHIYLKSKDGNITISDININTDPTSPNTDGMDLASTNILIENSHISDGDDNIEIGGSSPAANITVRNCHFGYGHGVSMGSYVNGGVSNVLVTDCTFTNTDYGIRMKSDNDRGGIVQNLSYYNLGMTNIYYTPILIYSYYNWDSSPTGDSPQMAASTNAATVTTTTPTWRNITISNLTATMASGTSSSRQAGMIWGRTEKHVSNVTLSKINITAPHTFALYNVDNIQFSDVQISGLVGGTNTYTLYNAQLAVTNSAPASSAVSIYGLTSTNSLALYSAPASMSSTNAYGANPITLSASVLTNNNNLTLPASTVVNFTLGTSSAQVAVATNLVLNSTLNIASGAGFGTGTYTLFTYGGTLGGTPTLGTTPAGYSCNLDTSTSGQVNLNVSH